MEFAFSRHRLNKILNRLKSVHSHKDQQVFLNNDDDKEDLLHPYVNFFQNYKYAHRRAKWVCFNEKEELRFAHLLEQLTDDNYKASTESLEKLFGHIWTLAVTRYLIDPYCITALDAYVYLQISSLYRSGYSDDKECEFLSKVKSWVAFFEHEIRQAELTTSEGNKASDPAANEDKLAEANFIKHIIEQDIVSGKHTSIVTRFPPEPNGFLHLGHAKSICLNFGLARHFKGRCHLRFDDTNPENEDERYVKSIQEDVKWLGGDWGDNLYYTSDYFPQLCEWAAQLIKQGDAYMDHQTEEEVRINRGSITQPGVDSPYRTRSIQENLDLFRRFERGEFKEGECVLRAKIDMAHTNPIMRDPLLYRMKCFKNSHAASPWCIYPTYDFAHGQSDSIENITHSICTLEFEDHRPLYEWFQEKLNIPRTRQIEFARLNCSYVVMSKRKLNLLVSKKLVNDWDDPRLPTLAGLRRRGVPSSALIDFCERVGVTKRDTLINLELLWTCTTNALHSKAFRYNVVLDPLRVVITNIDPNEMIDLTFPNHPELPHLGERKTHFGRVIYIERSDFQVNAAADYHRLAPKKEVRLKYGFWITCNEYRLDPDTQQVTEVLCTYDPQTRGGHAPPDNRKVKGSIHWISEYDAQPLNVRMYENLFTIPQPDSPPEAKEWEEFVNKDSVKEYQALGENILSSMQHPYLGGMYCQFERIGFFVADYSSTETKPVFNMTVKLLDTWSAKTNAASETAKRKEQEKLAREKAAKERELKKKKKAEKAAQKSIDQQK